MVRFSCFNAHTPSHKPKKIVESSTEAMHKTLQDPSLNRLPKFSLHDTSSNSLFVKMEADIQANDTKSVKTSVPAEQSWNLGEINGHLDENRDDRGHQKRLLRKSQSLGSALCHEGNFLHHNDLEEETDQRFSSDSPDQNGLVGPNGSKDSAVSPTSQHQKDPQSDSVHVGSYLLNTESLFSIGDPQHSEKEGPENSDAILSGEGANPSGNNTPHGSSTIVRSHSLPNIGPSVPTSGGCFHEYVIPHSISSEDLHVLDKMKEIAVHEVERQVMSKQEIDQHKGKSKINDVENPMDDVYDSFNYSALAKDWILPVTDESNLVKHLQGESSVQRWDEFESKDFKVKRIEEWVNDLQHFSPLEEANQLTETIDTMKRDTTALNGLTAAKMESKATPGMETAKQYISSLGASATTAQLSNHGLTVIPFLSAFVSLKVLNLSGNSIARITAGVLPRGLHVLNLSKNNISAIEGLRELTRLRVLDLSYNRIFRIGHGLASCSALKELYLAGNKISEVEGLHRLLKLTVLDLRFNKISTAKCLGQLAANYNSLQAISLEGNPAQKNVGDEQLKKYLQGLLPHLVYFNRQPIKTSTLKDAADRSVRLGIGAHQFERGLRSDNKAGRKAGHGLAGSRPSSSHGRKNQAMVSLKQSRGHVHLPPSTKAPASNHYHHFDLGSKLLNFRSGLSIQRSQSEGTLGAF